MNQGQLLCNEHKNILVDLWANVDEIHRHVHSLVQRKGMIAWVHLFLINLITQNAYNFIYYGYSVALVL